MIPDTDLFLSHMSPLFEQVMLKDGGSVCLDTTDENNCNWMCLVPTATSVEEQNLMAVQMGGDIYYITTKVIAPDTELRVWYAPHYARKVGRSVEPDGNTSGMLSSTVDLLIFYQWGTRVCILKVPPVVSTC